MTVPRWAPPWLGQRATRATLATRTMLSLERLDASHGEETSMDGKQVVFLENVTQLFVLTIFPFAGSVKESQTALDDSNSLR